MKASQQTIQQIERTLRKVIAKFPQDSDPLMTDIHLLVSNYTGEIRTYNDDDEELDRCVVDEWIKSPEEDFYDQAATILRKCIQNLRHEVEKMSILQPFSFVLIDEDHETLQDLVIIDSEETVVFDHQLLEGFEEDLDQFFDELLKQE